ncbi:MAG: ATPase P [Desulfobulbaceae bacterium]|nr:MAG: ATPase P [Desulfobulbaceae bacterium]
MLEITVPGYKTLLLEHLVLDYNGTIGCDGFLMEGLSEQFEALSPLLSIHVITADTHGFAASQLADLPCQLTILPEGQQDQAKRSFVQTLGTQKVVAIGNGRNDRLMLETAEIGIAVIAPEAVSTESLATADIVTLDIFTAMELLSKPARLIATLRL